MGLVKVIDLQPSFQAGPPDWNTLNRFKERVVSSVKEIMYSGIFKHPTGHLANSIRGYVSGNSVYIISDASYAKAQEDGVAAHTMWYLLGKTVPLRIFSFGQSKVIYRKATLKSYLNGAWRRKATPGKKMFATGISQAIDDFSEEFKDYNVFQHDA